MISTTLKVLTLALQLTASNYYVEQGRDTDLVTSFSYALNAASCKENVKRYEHADMTPECSAYCETELYWVTYHDANDFIGAPKGFCQRVVEWNEKRH